MAIFSASFTVSQSADCKTLTFTDTSNYSSNDSGITISSFSTGTRQFIVKSSTGAVLQTINMLISEFSKTFTLTVDAWVSVELKLVTNASVTYTKTNSVLSTCFLELCYSELVAKTDCDCSCSGSSCGGCGGDNKTRLLQHIKAAEIFSEYSNAVLAQKQLDAGTLICEASQNN
jgi:hypothetical protein